jgi:signal transduction histidine kinase
VVIAAVSVLVMMLLFRWYIKKLIINRVAYLESLARRVVGNELDLDIHLPGRDELSSLASSFDNMKKSLRLSIAEIEGHKDYLDNLLDNLIEGILIIDNQDRVIFVNRSFSQILEVDAPGPRTGDSVEETLFRNPTLSQIKELIVSTRERGSSAQDVMTLPFSGVREKNLEVHTGYLTLPPGQEPEIIIVIRDVTAIITFEKQVYQSDKLATVGRLAAGVAHEINNPMATILTCSEGLLKRWPEDDGTVEEYLEIIRTSARRCKLITQKLLEYSAGSELHKETIDLVAVVEEAVSLLQFEASKKSVTVSMKRDHDHPAIVGSRDSLTQVFVNLILNSIQAVDTDGRIEVEMSASNGRLAVTVTDNGTGISADNRGRVFEPFFTTKPVGIGTGLGMSVSQGIVKQHQGQIEIVASRPGHTAIKVTLPLHQNQGNQHG